MSKGCGCGGKPKPKPGSGQAPKAAAFTLESQGIMQTFGSRLERDAEWIRGGRSGTRRP